MRRIAKFHKVSLEQFMEAVKDEFPDVSELGFSILMLSSFSVFK